MTQYEKDIEAGLVDPTMEPQPDGRTWKEHLEYRIANRDWLRESFIMGFQILDALEAKGWTKSDLARHLGVSPQAVRKYVNGSCEFGLPLKHKLQKALGVKLGEAYVSYEPYAYTVSGELEAGTMVSLKVNRTRVRNINSGDTSFSGDFDSPSAFTTQTLLRHG